jgi:hypothetical protein
MKPRNSIPLSGGAGRRGHTSRRIPTIPMEWMDPMSWRLPSGKALAEFWLQSGFLAPLMLGGPAIKRKKTKGPTAGQMSNVIASKNAEEAPERTGTFRETR